MRHVLILALIAAPAAATDVVRLTDAQRDAVIAAAANGPEKPPVVTPEQAQRQSVLDRSLYPEFFAPGGGPAADRKVHGEMTMFAGSGGTAGFSGTAIIPVGQSSTAAVSITQGTSRYGNISGFGFGFATGDAQRNFTADIGYNGFGGYNAFGYSPFGYAPPGYGRFGFGLGSGFGRPHRRWR
jgi:hypothetical protein